MDADWVLQDVRLEVVVAEREVEGKAVLALREGEDIQGHPLHTVAEQPECLALEHAGLPRRAGCLPQQPRLV